VKNERESGKQIMVVKNVEGGKIMMKQVVKVKLEELPDDLKKEVMDYIEFLLQKYGKRRKKEKFSFDWEGGLSEMKDKYTSVELQHKSLEWR
jgi:hypothetical protein